MINDVRWRAYSSRWFALCWTVELSTAPPSLCGILRHTGPAQRGSDPLLLELRTALVRAKRVPGDEQVLLSHTAKNGTIVYAELQEVRVEARRGHTGAG